MAGHEAEPRLALTSAFRATRGAALEAEDSWRKTSAKRDSGDARRSQQVLQKIILARSADLQTTGKKIV